ncbi:gentisate 1,2-dioxygenase [Rhizorhabdus dicambivorans]|uniref:DsmD n=1 Tax=Rhizorhabdus dicambivorans TaxID=1850238 RepID=A0A2H4ZC41_9SPHN|nr:cupin domain-containing protein [Rhizorhabdus dicambivorans]ATE65235.1 gentisate 1,2-dioxygenase [Rhizorhabdus dicambivorans]AUF73409.1 DsmD [Rhizorhabdus dicambivorans]
MTATSIKHAPSDVEEVRQAFYKDIARDDLAALWNVMGNFVKPEPDGPAKPALWNYSVVREHLRTAGELITAEEAERRVLILQNPGLPGSSLITRSLFAALQLVRPGEIAPCHRHSQNALRLIIEGGGAFTAVNGEKVYMEPFDLILTPAMHWHDHGNTTEQDVVWLDGLDLGIVQLFEASFANHFDGKVHPETRPAGDGFVRFGNHARPLTGISDYDTTRYGLYHYPYKQWCATLEQMRSDAPDPRHAHMIEFTNPTDGGPVLDTISCFAQLVPGGMSTKSARSSDGMVGTVVSGSGAAIISGERFKLTEKDMFIVPSWMPLELKAEADLTIFWFSDRAAQKKLGLWRSA